MTSKGYNFLRCLNVFYLDWDDGYSFVKIHPVVYLKWMHSLRELYFNRYIKSTTINRGRYKYTLTVMLKCKRLTSSRFNEDLKQPELSSSVEENVNWSNPLWKTYCLVVGNDAENTHILSIIQQFHF